MSASSREQATGDSLQKYSVRPDGISQIRPVDSADTINKESESAQAIFEKHLESLSPNEQYALLILLLENNSEAHLKGANLAQAIESLPSLQLREAILLGKYPKFHEEAQRGAAEITEDPGEQNRLYDFITRGVKALLHKNIAEAAGILEVMGKDAPKLHKDLQIAQQLMSQIASHIYERAGMTNSASYAAGLASAELKQLAQNHSGNQGSWPHDNQPSGLDNNKEEWLIEKKMAFNKRLGQMPTHQKKVFLNLLTGGEVEPKDLPLAIASIESSLMKQEILLAQYPRLREEINGAVNEIISLLPDKGYEIGDISKNLWKEKLCQIVEEETGIMLWSSTNAWKGQLSKGVAEPIGGTALAHLSQIRPGMSTHQAEETAKLFGPIQKKATALIYEMVARVYQNSGFIDQATYARGILNMKYKEFKEAA